MDFVGRRLFADQVTELQNKLTSRSRFRVMENLVSVRFRKLRVKQTDVQATAVLSNGICWEVVLEKPISSDAYCWLRVVAPQVFFPPEGAVVCYRFDLCGWQHREHGPDIQLFKASAQDEVIWNNWKEPNYADLGKIKFKAPSNFEVKDFYISGEVCF